MRKLLLPAMLVLAGCVSTPGYRAPDAVPAPRRTAPALGGSTPTPDPIGAELFNDTTLTRLLGEAVTGNFDLQSAVARVRSAQSTRRTSAFDFAPTVTAVAGVSRRRIASATFGGTFVIPDQTLFDVGAELSWEVDLFGRLRQQHQARGALVAAADADRRGVQVSLASAFAATYFELRGDQARLAVARRNAENQERSLDVVRERLDAGRGTGLDTERAAAQFRSTMARIPSLEARIRSAQLRLEALAGRARVEPDPALAALAPLPALPDTLVPGDLASIVRRRPDVASAERSYAAQRALSGAAKRDYLPKLSVNGNAGYTSLTFDSIGAAGTSRFSIGPVLSWPLLNLGRVKARADVASADEAAAGARYQGIALAARQEISAALVTYHASRHRLTDLGAAATASRKAAELARLRFESGIADFLQVLDAERTTLDAEDQFVLGQVEAATALVNVYRAMGGPWATVP